MKNIDEKILTADEEAKQLQNKRKKLISQQKQEERKKRDKNYKTIRAIKDTEKKIDDRAQLIDHAEKYLKYKYTYKAYTKLKKNKQDTFYNEHPAEII